MYSFFVLYKVLKYLYYSANGLYCFYKSQIIPMNFGNMFSVFVSLFAHEFIAYSHFCARKNCLTPNIMWNNILLFWKEYKNLGNKYSF